MGDSSHSLARFQLEFVHEPVADLYETATGVVIEVELPGVEPEDIVIRLMDDMVVVEGVRAEASAPEGRGRKYLCMERNVQSFRRMLSLPSQVDGGAARAKFENGVLTLRFPKHMASKGIKIKIEHGG